MGFTQVYDYAAGKLDWLAAGLPTEGSAARHPRAGDVGWDACVVVNQERVVLGLLRAKELDADPGLRIEQAMRPGPSTFRPHRPIEEMAEYMVEHKLENSPITTSDGRLVGLLRQTDAVAKARQLVEAEPGEPGAPGVR